jgi:hypothetical protein
MRRSEHRVRLRNVYKTCVTKREGRGPFGRPGLRWENITMDRKEIGSETVDLVNTMRTGSRGGSHLNIVMNLRVHKRRSDSRLRKTYSATWSDIIVMKNGREKGSNFCRRKLLCSSISMSGMGAQGDPCTATIFWSILSLLLLYSASSPVRPTKYSILHNGISSQSLGSYVYLSDENWVQLILLHFCSCTFLAVHISLKNRELQSSSAEPHEGGRHIYDRRIVCDTAVTTSVSSSLRQVPYALASVDQSPVCRLRHYPPPSRLVTR